MINTNFTQRLGARTDLYWLALEATTNDPAFYTPWNPPGEPQKPFFDETQYGLDPRSWDYPAYQNITLYEPVGRDRVTYADLRNFADECEILRAVLENTKNQISTLQYEFHLKNTEGMSPQQVKDATENNANIIKCREFFKKPDGFNSFRSWIKMVLEEISVIDKLCIFNEVSYLQKPLNARIIDGATIIKKIDKNGVTPLGTNIAYQQKIMGTITSEFTTSQMFVYHSTPRVHKLEGFSAVERIIQIVKTALNRSKFQANYYTEGNIPDMFLRVTDKWQDDQLAKYQKYFDRKMAGNLRSRRRVHFIPEGLEPIFPQKDVLKDEFDEWLARVICYVFGVSANTFIRNLNRATGEQQREQSDEEGFFSRMAILKEIIDTLIQDWLGIQDVEFVWIPNKAQDSLKQAQIDEIHVNAGIRSRDEVRLGLGLPPIGVGCAVTVSKGLIALETEQLDAEWSLTGGQEVAETFTDTSPQSQGN